MHEPESKVCETDGQEASYSLEEITLAKILVFEFQFVWASVNSWIVC